MLGGIYRIAPRERAKWDERAIGRIDRIVWGREGLALDIVPIGRCCYRGRRNTCGAWVRTYVDLVGPSVCF